ncbi:MAG: hypothetical protein JXB32_11525 [Deltaproteobacteria bacterium]|nr:hypothetical protein [Deltaproteobacteria bacterium]
MMVERRPGRSARGLGWCAAWWSAAVLVAALAGCDGEEATPARIVVHVLVPDGVNPLVGTTRLVLTFEKPNVATFVEETPADVGSMTELVYTYTFPESEATAVLEVVAEDAAGYSRAHGRSIPFDIVSGRTLSIGVLMLVPGQWATAPATLKLATARMLHGAAVTGDGGLMVAGGTTATGVTPTVELFDLNAMAPVPAADVPTLPAARSRFAMLALNADQVLLVGGVTASTQADLWNGPAATWTPLPLPAEVPEVWAGPRFATLGDGRALLWGGVDGSDAPVSALVRAGGDGLSRLDGTTDRNDPAGVPVMTPDGLRFLLVGGNEVGLPFASLLDPVTGAIEDDVTAPTDELRTRHTVIRVGASRALVAGGYGATGTLSTFVWIFDGACLDPAAGCVVWSSAGPMLGSVGGVADAVGVGIDPGNEDPRAVLVGGVDASDRPLPEALVLNAETGVAARYPLRTPRAYGAVVRLPAGQIVYVGGLDGDGNPLDTIELFEPPAL